MTCERHVWENGVMTDVKEPRTLAVFVREVSAMGGLKTVVQFGSLILDRGVTVEQATAALNKADYSDEIEFVAKPDSDFYKVVLL